MTIIIDADSHVSETPELFLERLPSKYGDLIPRVRFRDDLGADWWFVDDVPIQAAVGSVMLTGDTGEPVRSDSFEVMLTRVADQHPSSYDPNERVKVMDRHGIVAATTYPWLGLTGPDVWQKLPASLEFQMAVVAAYNDWILTWATAQPGRFIPLACLPYWDVPSAVHEIERCADMGMRGLVMSGKPQNHGCPLLADRHWDPMWRAAEAAGLSISFHSAGGGVIEAGYPARRTVMGSEMLAVFATTVEFLSNASSGIDIIASGVLQRFPELHFVVVESGAGWVPFALETLDEHYRRFRPWETRDEFTPDQLPSELFQRQVFVNAWYEQLTPRFPLDNIMFETDYPHPTCLLGEEINEAINDKMADLTDEQKENVLYRNALRCFKLDAAEYGLVD